MTVKVISWNIDGRAAPWHRLIAMDADVALLQEAGEPPQDLVRPIDVDPAPWRTAGRLRWPRRTAIAKLSDRVNVEWIEAQSLVDADAGEFAVSRPGTLTAAIVMAPDTEPFVVVSMYSLWEKLHASVRSSWRIVSDASAHRVVSDLSAFIGRQDGSRILAAGDLNILHGHGEGGSEYWASRYGTVFARMEALGLPFVGPQAPNGQQAQRPPFLVRIGRTLSRTSFLSRLRWSTVNSSVWAALLRKLVSSSYISGASRALETSFSRS